MEHRVEPSMQRMSGYLAGFGGAVALLAVIVSLEVEVAAARGGFEPAPINRMLKGDRLVAPAGISSAQSLAPQANEPKLPDAKLPDECHATFSASKNVFSAEIAGRCVS
jgi:hypothetical protein